MTFRLKCLDRKITNSVFESEFEFVLETKEQQRQDEEYATL